MPLRAKDAENQEYYSFIDEARILELAPGTLLCPHCDARVGFRQKSTRRNRQGREYPVIAYFFHITRQCATAFAHHKESREHQEAKLQVIEKMQERSTEYRGATWQTEVAIPEIKRIADVLFTFPDGRRVVHEVQLSPQSQHDFATRTSDYESAGYEVRWWLGPRVKQHDRWCLEELGMVGYIEIEYDESTIDLGDNQDRAAWVPHSQPHRNPVPPANP